MKGKEWALVIVVCLVIAVLVSVVTVNVTGNVVGIKTTDDNGKTIKPILYTREEIDQKLNSVTDIINQKVAVVADMACARYFTTGEGSPTTFTLAGKTRTISLGQAKATNGLNDVTVDGQVVGTVNNLSLEKTYALKSGGTIKIKDARLNWQGTGKSRITAVLNDC